MEVKEEAIQNLHPNKIKVAEFLTSWDGLIPSNYFVKDAHNPEDTQFLADFNIPEEMLPELETVCGADTLHSKHKFTKIEDQKGDNTASMLYEIPSDTELETLRIQREKVDQGEETSERLFLRYPHRTPELKEEDRSISDGTPFDPDVVLTIQFCEPFTKEKKTLRIDKEVNLRGCQYLTELRDKLSCCRDLAIPGDFSYSLDISRGIPAKDLYKSGFFFIGGVFYNDMRDLACRDYSESILKWARERDRGFGPLEAKNMEESRFLDLTIQLGKPYVYVHQGDCEHFLIFTSIRLLHETDIQPLSEYPIIIKDRIKMLQKCRCCRIFSAKWLVRGSNLLPEDPCMLCESCLKLILYDENGTKIGDFVVNIFVDQSLRALPE